MAHCLKETVDATKREYQIKIDHLSATVAENEGNISVADSKIAHLEVENSRLRQRLDAFMVLMLQRRKRHRR